VTKPERWSRNTPTAKSTIFGRLIEQHLRTCADCAVKHRAFSRCRPSFAPGYYFQRRRAARAVAGAPRHRVTAPARPRPGATLALASGALWPLHSDYARLMLGTAVLDWRANEDVAVRGRDDARSGDAQ
jgi:hypothetical protein